jgi:hypothetical protein
MAAEVLPGSFVQVRENVDLYAFSRYWRESERAVNQELSRCFRSLTLIACEQGVNSPVRRRDFVTTAIGISVIPIAGGTTPITGQALTVKETRGTIRKQEGDTPIPGATWYVAETEGDALVYTFTPGMLAKMKYVACDMLLDGDTMTVFNILLQEGERGRRFSYTFSGLNQCSFRMRFPLSFVDQSRWRLEREGAFLKPMSGGDRVDLEKVDRLTFVMRRKSAKPARWCMTPLTASATDVEKLTDPTLPKGPLLDQFGQYTLRDWPGKTTSVDELKTRVTTQLANADKQVWPEAFSRWGGWKSRKIGEGTGFFRTHNDGSRWWLVDPDGYAFWSTGLDCVRVDTEARVDGITKALAWIPEQKGEFADAYGSGRGLRLEGQTINYLAANMIRALGRNGWRDQWAKIVLAEMKRLRFNTVANWSDYEIARAAQFPYVRPMNFSGRRSGMVYRDFPDVYHAGFDRDVADYASQLKNTAKDPAFIGYFLMNEPTWGFSSELPAAGMLYTTEQCATRSELARFLKTKYADDTALGNAWGAPATFDRVAKGKWSGVLNKAALADLRDFSVKMVDRYFNALSKTCKQVDPNHLNLGMRWAGPPPEWAVEGMKSFDVFSINCYEEKLPLALATKIHSMVKRPVMVGEWHFGALDVGLPASGIGHTRNQVDRAKAYRNYLEDAAADPYCVGVHWFTLYDQSAVGRFDGENYNIGFLDICNRPYDEMGTAAIASHERMYDVAAGRVEPYSDKIEYLPKLFL